MSEEYLLLAVWLGVILVMGVAVLGGGSSTLQRAQEVQLERSERTIRGDLN